MAENVVAANDIAIGIGGTFLPPTIYSSADLLRSTYANFFGINYFTSKLS